MNNKTRSIAVKPALESIDYYMVGISRLAGFSNPIKLSSNESALGMSPLALEACKKSAGQCHLYPEVDTEKLAQAIASRHRLNPERMAFGPGSDELLQRIVNAFTGPGQQLVHSKNAYMQFPIYAKLAGATAVAAEDVDLRYSIDSILGQVTEKTRCVLLANPDNPSGTYLGGDEIRRLHRSLPANVLVIIDAAYDEYALADDYESGTNLVHEFENIIVTRTFSKVHGMAGLRLGWCYGPKWVIELLTRIGPSFPVNTIANAAGIASMQDLQHTAKVLDHNSRWIHTLGDEFAKLGLKVYPSQTNFILVQFPPDCGASASQTNRHLNANGIIPRQFALEDFSDKLRFTVGTGDEMEKTIDVMQRFFHSR
ncbi:MAG: histidinol-phosphate transaminase [Acidiferrobacterales bacterium]|nr:histidinol-phosphate transaminase [Acidiferrobacterales bacterium]